MLVGFGALLEGFSKATCLGGEDHEFLEGETAAGVGTSVQDIEGRDGKDKGFFGSGEVGNVGVKWDSLKIRIHHQIEENHTFSAAAARVQAIDTPRIAFAPSLASD